MSAGLTEEHGGLTRQHHMGACPGGGPELCRGLVQEAVPAQSRHELVGPAAPGDMEGTGVCECSDLQHQGVWRAQGECMEWSVPSCTKPRYFQHLHIMAMRVA